MIHVSIDFMADAYCAACCLDVESFKPGNVSQNSPGHGMTHSDFVRSAEHSVNSLLDPVSELGARILQAVSAAHSAVGCNTNLGIVLLVAPLVQGCLDWPGEPLETAVRRVLADTTIADARAVYHAIRLMTPGGLGRVMEQDVADEPSATLREVMSLAAQHDLIARQYANGFRELFDVALPYFSDARTRHDEPTHAMTDLYLFLLARFPDTHIQRKFGRLVAAEVSAHAAELHHVFHEPQKQGRHWADLWKFDIDLKRRGINPGTTADLCVAADFLHRLLMQEATHAGPAPDHSRTERPGRAEVPRSRAAK